MSRTALVVEANKKAQKKTKVVLTQDIQGVGAKGQVKQVALGFFRNFLLPNGATKATSSVLEQIKQQEEVAHQEAAKVKAEAQAFADQLASADNLVIKKKVGNKKQIYGSVKTSEIAGVILQHTGRDLVDATFTVPPIKETGSYECSVRLHPEVNATFRIKIEQELTIKKH